LDQELAALAVLAAFLLVLVVAVVLGVQMAVMVTVIGVVEIMARVVGITYLPLFQVSLRYELFGREQRGHFHQLAQVTYEPVY
jgi:ABC-type multidrug transport system permease subunit